MAVSESGEEHINETEYHMEVGCPHCGNPINVVHKDAEFDTQFTVNCPDCGGRFIISIHLQVHIRYGGRQ